MDEAAKYRSQESVLRQSVEQKQVTAKFTHTHNDFLYLYSLYLTETERTYI